MGTNYYLRLKNPPKSIPETFKAHIGKSSCGWRFLFKKYLEIQTFESWKKLIEDDAYIIVDEYGDEANKEDFFAMVAWKQKDASHEIVEDPHYINIGGYDFLSCEFS